MLMIYFKALLMNTMSTHLHQNNVQTNVDKTFPNMCAKCIFWENKNIYSFKLYYVIYPPRTWLYI